MEKQWDLVLHDVSRGIAVVHEHEGQVMSVVPSEQLFAVGNRPEIFCPTCHRKFGDDSYEDDVYRDNQTEYRVESPKDDGRIVATPILGPIKSKIVRKSFRSKEYFDLLAFHTSNDDMEVEEDKDSTSPASSTEAVSNLPPSMFNENYYSRFFKQIRKIGSGAFGAVYLVDHHLSDIQLGTFAVKVVPVGDNRDWLIRQLAEVRALVNLHNNYIISYQHAWLEMFRIADFGPRIPCLFILMEYANSGNLGTFINMKRKNGLREIQNRKINSSNAMFLDEENEIWPFLIDIIIGLRYLHHSGIIHRDIKPENLLLHSATSIKHDIHVEDVILAKNEHVEEYNEPDVRHEPSELALWNPDEFSRKKPRLNHDVGVRPSILITDFGQSESVSRANRQPRSGATGTMAYCAPELLFPSAFGEYLQNYDSKCDIYSLGMVLYVMSFSELPYSESSLDSMDSLLLAIRTMEKMQAERHSMFPAFPESDVKGYQMPLRSPALLNLIKSLLAIDPRQRPDVDSLISNPTVLMHDKFHRLSAFLSHKVPTIPSQLIPPDFNLDDNSSIVRKSITPKPVLSGNDQAFPSPMKKLLHRSVSDTTELSVYRSPLIKSQVSAIKEASPVKRSPFIAPSIPQSIVPLDSSLYSTSIPEVKNLTLSR